MQIRRAGVEDAPAISALITSHLPLLTVRPDGAGAGRFLESIAPQAIEVYVTAPNFRYGVAESGSRLAGVVAVRDGTHLFHLFVAGGLQRQGLARRLWAHAMLQAQSSGPVETFTVNASLFAVPAYERLGFVVCGKPVEQHGVAFVPMRTTPGGMPSVPV